MATLKIEIHTENAAFLDEYAETQWEKNYARNEEIKRVLANVCNQLDNGRESGKCIDINGNTVGNWELEEEMLIKGFTFPYGKKDVFVETSLKNKTQRLASAIIRGMVNVGIDIPDSPGTRKAILDLLRPAVCEIKGIGRKYYEIHGDGFGGCGSFIDDGMTIIIKI